jgi:phosphatidylserine decarboxylase
MKHSDKARQAALRLLGLTLLALLALLLIFFAGFKATVLRPVGLISIAGFLAGVWVLFAIFTLYFFRDPTPTVPAGPNLVVSPAHGTVDAIGETSEPLFMGGNCQRVSIFLSVFNVHVQNAPVSGRIAFYRYTTGKFLNAMKSESAIHNENLLLGIEASENPGVKIGVRLLAGLIARRIVPFVNQGEATARGERISLIQFGSRADLYLPLAAKIKVKLGDRVVGGETIMAALE